jgi:hypothetical protein
MNGTLVLSSYQEILTMQKSIISFIFATTCLSSQANNQLGHELARCAGIMHVIGVNMMQTGMGSVGQKIFNASSTALQLAGEYGDNCGYSGAT